MARGIRRILLMLTVFLMFLLPAQADVSVETVELTPNNPKTNDNLVCDYNITATNGEVLEQVNLTWYNASQVHTTTSIPLTDNTNQTSGTRTILPTETKKGETWECEVYALGNASNENTKSASQIVYNTEPVISSISNKEVNVDKLLSFRVSAQDADVADGTDELTYQLNNAPQGMAIDGNQITWRPTMEQKGTYDVDVIVTDNEGANDMTSFTVEVTQMMLAVDDLDVDCSPSCDDNLDEEDGGSIEEVRPGSTMELQITLENLWDDDADDHDIDDIEIIGTLEDMGDEDEQEEEATKSRIRPGEDEDFTLEFDIPNDADEDTYDLELEITGEDEDGTDYEIILDIDVEVEKEDDKMTFDRANLLPSIVSCDRNVELDVRVKNIGADDQDDAQLSVRSSDLEIDEHEFFDVEEGDYDDEETEFERSYNLNIADSVAEGTYDIEVRAYYEDGGKYERETLSLEVRDCQSTQPQQPDGNGQQEEEEEEEVEVIEDQTPPTQTQGPQVAQPVTETEESFYDSTAFLAILIAAFVILLVAVILLAVVAFRR